MGAAMSALPAALLVDLTISLLLGELLLVGFSAVATVGFIIAPLGLLLGGIAYLSGAFTQRITVKTKYELFDQIYDEYLKEENVQRMAEATVAQMHGVFKGKLEEMQSTLKQLEVSLAIEDPEMLGKCRDTYQSLDAEWMKLCSSVLSDGMPRSMPSLSLQPEMHRLNSATDGQPCFSGQVAAALSSSG